MHIFRSDEDLRSPRNVFVNCLRDCTTIRYAKIEIHCPMDDSNPFVQLNVPSERLKYVRRRNYKLYTLCPA